MSRCSQCGEITKLKTEDSNIVPGPVADITTTARYLRLLCTNDPPLKGPVLAHIQDIVSKTRQRLASLDTNISDLRAQLMQLEDERSLLSDSLQKNTAVTSPLRWIPPEVLAEIFTWTLPEHYEKPARVDECPWVLGHICSRWREIALSTPSLWSFSFIAGVHPNRYPLLPMIEAQIQRARTLRVHFMGCETSHSSPQIERFDLLSKHSERWEELSIQLTSALVPRLSALQGRLSSLRKLWVRWDNEDSDEGLEFVDCFESASSLVDAGFAGESRFIPILLPLHQLTVYRVDCPWKEHQEALRAAPNLIEARINVMFQDDPWPNPSDTVIDMLHLRRLFVTDVNILRILRAPALDGIGIDTAPGEELDVTRELDAFLVRSSCTPRRLCLSGSPEATTTAAVLNKHICISSCVLVFDQATRTSSTAFAGLMTMFTRADTAPNLGEICIGSHKPFAINYSLLLKMVESRRNADRPLGEVTVLMSGWDPDPATIVGFRALEDAGLVLSVGTVDVNHLRSWKYTSPNFGVL
ncbi:hypothetical protein FB45DRAFT_1069411 [Roridomyces roridus]|uniref:F-box domain-containing protein n=1 Tax=Roridomyces roridus TaxID=1738132 RepID=A0AAD7AZF1_9AGAR|nr:hypothetical protein FB45DRAFT_1069411 [Roridomyces roridus]